MGYKGVDGTDFILRLGDGSDILVATPEGEIYVKGRLARKDEEVAEKFVEWMKAFAEAETMKVH